MTVSEFIEIVGTEIRSAWRFRWTGIATAWLCCIVGWTGITMMPNVFEARARVFVDTSSVLAPLLNNRIVPVELGTELHYVRQALLGRDHLERVIRENGLDAEVKTAAEKEELLNTLRTDIQIASRDNTNTLYSITYRSNERDKAVGVVGTLLTSLVETTLGAGRDGTQTAEDFVDARIAEYESRLQAAEDARADFKKKNADRLPGSEGGYFERMRLQSQTLEDTRRSLRLAKARRDRLVAQLQGESPVVPTGNTPTPELAPNSIDARIRDYRAKLDTLLLQYTERHPDVISTREALNSLERQRREQLESIGVEDDDIEMSSLGSNPIYQATRIALNEIEVEIEALEVDVDEQARSVRRLQELIDDVPQVEAELARLNRDYDVIYEQYQGLVRSRETQNLSRKAADTEEIQFRIIDPPTADFKPVAPKRELMMAIVFLASFGLGAGLCWLLSQVRPVFTNATDLARISGLPILGSVTRIRDANYVARSRRGLLAFVGAVSILVALFVATVVVELAGPGLRQLVGIG